MDERAYKETIKQQNVQIQALRKAIERVQAMLQQTATQATRAREMARQLHDRVSQLENSLSRLRIK